MPTDPLPGGQQPAVFGEREMRALWKTIYENRDDLKSCRLHIEGGTRPDGTYQEGLITQHKQTRIELDVLKAGQATAAAKKDDRRWYIVSGLVGFSAGEAFKQLLAYVKHIKGGS